MAKLLQINRFCEVIKGATLEGLDGVFCRTVSGDHHAALAPMVCLEFGDQRKPQPVRQTHVGDQYIKLVFGQQCACLLQIARRVDLVAFAQQGEFIQRAQVGLIVNHQDPCMRCIGLHDARAAWLVVDGVSGGWVQNITLNSLPGCISW